MNLRFAGWAILTALVATLIGCGGGGSGAAGGGVSSTAPGVTFTAITVNSPPVVSFSVKDSAGKPVPGLKLFDPAGSTGDPACGGANVSFTIAKYDGANWQSLISRQRFSSSSPGQNAVIEGATDPTNPTELNGPSTPRVVGQLAEANGVYTYQFATDVTTPLLLANAAAGDLLGKVANNGNLAVKDGQTIHRVALQLCFVDPETQATVKINPFMDFTLGANGQGVPFKNSQGRLAPAIQVADRASCNECHQNLAHHNPFIDPAQPDTGAYVDPQVCVMCHNPGSSDYNTGNPIDFKLMVHKLHMGKRLTQNYVVGSAIARQDQGGGVIAGVLYPQDQRNCVKCHDSSANAAHKTAQGFYWIARPSKNACFACHDDYKNPASKWQAFHAPYANLSGMFLNTPDLIQDFTCQTCHNALGGVAHTSAQEHEIQEWTRGANYQYNIWGITKNPDDTLTVEYSVSNPSAAGNPDYDILDPQYQFTVADGTATTKRFRFGALNILFGWNTTDYSNNGAVGRAWNSRCTIAPASTCDATTGLPKAGAAGPLSRGQPVAINVMFDPSVVRVGSSNRFRLTSTVLPVVANGTVAVAFQGYVGEMKKDLTGSDIPNASLNVQVKSKVEYFAMSGNTIDRRQVVSSDTCNACHGQNLDFTSLDTLKPVTTGNDGIHDGSQTDPMVCVICHNGNLDGTSALGGQADSGHFKRMIHMMHKAQGTNYPVMPSTLVVTGDLAGTGTYTGIINCNVCHVNNSHEQNPGVLGSSTSINTVDPSNPLLNNVISPKASVCSSCHADADPAITHMIGEGGAAFGTLTQADILAGKLFEACDGCHQPGGLEPVDTAHLRSQP